MPFVLVWPLAYAWIVESSCGTAAPVAMTCVVIEGWLFSTDCTPLIRGSRLSAPGVAMNSARSPDGTSSAMRPPRS